MKEKKLHILFSVLFSFVSLLFPLSLTSVFAQEESVQAVAEQGEMDQEFPEQGEMAREVPEEGMMEQGGGEQGEMVPEAVEFEIFEPRYPNNKHLFIRNYDPIEYRGQDHIYGIAQDERGVMYMGNNVYGVMEFDGINWINIPLANNNLAYSLAPAKDGRMYVGGFDELGYIEVVNEVSKYKSLVDQLPEGVEQFGIVSSVEATDKGIYFKVGGDILRRHEEKFTVISNPSSGKFGEVYSLRGKIYTYDAEGTVFEIDGDVVKTIFKEDIEAYGGNIFKTDDPQIPGIYFILPYGEDELLLGSYNNGLIIAGGGDLRKFENEAEDAGLIDQNYSSGSIILPNGEYAVSTISGVVILDREGKLKAWINQDNGLAGNRIRSIFADNQNFLWIGTSYGFSQVLYPSPFSVFDESSGFEGQIRMSMHFGENIYVVTSTGAFRGSPTSFDTIGMKFQKIPNIDGETGNIKKYGNSVLIANFRGLFQIIAGPPESEPDPNEQMNTIFVTEEYSERLFLPLAYKYCRFIEVSRKYPGIVYVGTANSGLFVLREKNNKWEQIGNIKIEDQMFYGAEDSAGILWVSGVATGGYSLDFSSGDFAKPEVRNFYKNEGLPEGWYVPSAVGDELYMYSDEAFLRYDGETQKFVADKTFFEDLTDTGFLMKRPDGNVWITKGRPRKLSLAIRKEDGGFELTQTPFQRFDNFQIRNFGFDADGISWFGSGGSLLSYDPRVEFNYSKPYRSLIRKVTVNGSPVFGKGSLDIQKNGDLKPIAGKGGKGITLSHDENNIRFDFAGLYIDTKFKNSYQVWLEGLNPHWSEWSDAFFKEYNSLAPKDYTFRVRARNLYGTVSQEAVFRFRILLPWWETWWFYLSEIGVFLSLLLISIVMNRTGEPTRFSKTVTLITVVVVFESIMMNVESLGEVFTGGIPLIQLLLNVVMAMLFEPAQNLLGTVLIGKRKRRKLRVSFGSLGSWSGGTAILESLKSMDDFSQWKKNFHKEFQDIGRKYSKYMLEDLYLSDTERADIVAELEDLLGGLWVFRRYLTKGHPVEFSALDPKDHFKYQVEIFPNHWKGNGLQLMRYRFDLEGFIDWYQQTMNKIKNIFEEYSTAMEDQTLKDRERENLIALVEEIIMTVIAMEMSLVLVLRKEKQPNYKDVDLAMAAKGAGMQ